MSEPFIAEIRIFAGNFAPRGWAFCDGQLLPIAENTALFSLIGTTYGGDGRTTTGLPNMQGRAPMHPGRGPGLTARRLGERDGIETVTLSEAQMPSHTHGLRATGARGTEENPGNTTSVAATFPVAAFSSGESSSVYMDSETLSGTGGSQSHNNMQPYLALNFIIALVGLYPSRS
ncbi:phage tail protein [Rhodobacter sp. TJ_12]|uniref:phage tail protein n=1 Tax=Rhodobacter sp. TJ_12 TaxID=2029399 RepID=UPI001CBBDFAA|nr:tail fiber protein [Rhodobacter sp. TJ_12]MBZ4024117.1 phage tail protein [Rhodobacter sp. TJ_12]